MTDRLVNEARSVRGQVLVAIMNNQRDFAIAHDQNWYRIPVRSVERFLKERWPPEWLAFYQTKVFGPEAHAVRYYARVLDIRQVFRWELFPEEPHDDKSSKRYFQLVLTPLQELPQPIFSWRWRRIVFIPTTWNKFISAAEINDLYDDSLLEDRLWAAFKRHDIPAERQFFIQARDQIYALDFAIFCDRGNIDVEANSVTWHAGEDRFSLDRERNNDLAGLGWLVVRFNGQQIREQIAEYCIPNVMTSINRLGGLKTEGLVPRKFNPDDPAGPRQLTVFEEAASYDID
jgi:very-short-patch-repair endonuclease